MDCSPSGFRTARVFEAGWGFDRRLVTADFDGDGRTDLATADGSRHTVDVLLNEGGGWFGAPVRYGVGLGPSALAAADFNGDGRADLAVVNESGGDVSILLGGAGGVFGAATSFTVGARPDAIVADDFNGDGKADVAVSRDGGRVSLLLGDGVGAFTHGAGVDFIVGRVSAAADFNSDGRRDLVVTGSAGVAVLAGDGAGGFPGGPSFSYGGGMSAVAGDLNGDGKADLALGSLNDLVILLGDGAGNFSAPSLINDGITGGVNVRAVGDLDGDGRQDVVATGLSVGLTVLFRGDGAGGFSRGRSYPSFELQTAAVIGDFDGDGRRDIAAAGFNNTSMGVVSVLLNTGGGDFQAALGVDTIGLPSDFALGDFNADGVADMVVLHRGIRLRFTSLDARVAFHLGDASGGFRQTYVVPDFGGPNVGLVTADFNRDGKADVAVGRPQGYMSFVSVYLSNGDGTFADPKSVSVPFELSQLVAGNFNGDANPDVVAVSSSSQRFTTLLGDGGGGFDVTAAQDAGTGRANVYPFAGDFDGDGVDDLVLTDYENGRVLALPGKATGLFGEARPAAVPGRPSGAVVGDFNRDGKKDVAVTSHPALQGGDAGSVSVLLGDGAGGFAPAAVVYRAEASPGPITAGDFDGDGNTDLAFATFRWAFVLSGDGGGAFGPAVRVEAEDSFLPLVAHDFNADGRADLAANGLRSNAMGILFSEGTPLPCLSADDVTVAESAQGTPPAQVTVRLSAASAQVVRVNYTTRAASLDAYPERDFTPLEGTLIFRPGETAQTLSIPVHDDPLDENEETFVVRLYSPLNARIGDDFGVVKVVDDDPPPSISIKDVTVAEDDSPFANTFAVFTLSLSAPSGRMVIVDYVSSDGTATASDDYRFVQSRAFLGAGQTTGTIAVPLRADLISEPDEHFFIKLSQPQNCVIEDGEAVGVITDDDAPAVQFGAGALAVNESDGSVRAQVTRAGDLSRASTVNYSTGDGAASGRTDYNRTLGALRFEPGEASKTVTVFVTDDALVEDPETFDIRLGDAVDCELGSPSVVSITINSNDAAAGTNPADDTSFFVRQHYRDFLSRDPDAAGLAFWTNEIDSCGADAQCREVRRVNVSAAFFLSIEFQQTGFLAHLTHKAAFGDLDGKPVPITSDETLQDAQVIGDGLVVNAEGWELTLERNKRAYFDRMAASLRFVAAHPPAMTPEQYVDALNANAGGALSQAERDALVGELKGGLKTRAQALRAVAEDPDLSGAETRKAFVLMQYFGYLRRSPDAAPDTDYAGYDFWLRKLDRFGGDFIQAEMVKAFINSDEYRKRFGQ
ncbi:MAG TPA: FG-GAP-like repeat-containing protein [Pyrinomonadaceae bacterium]